MPDVARMQVNGRTRKRAKRKFNPMKKLAGFLIVPMFANRVQGTATPNLWSIREQFITSKECEVFFGRS